MALATLIAIALPTLGWGQTTRVSGRIFDALSGAPLPYVSVVFSAAGDGTMTDENGQFELSTTSRPGRLSVAYLGYAGQSFDVLRGQEQHIDIGLEPRAFDLGTVEVRPDRSEKNPAKPFMQRVFEAKSANNPRNLPAGTHRIHTRIQSDINDIEPDIAEAWYWGPFDFIFNYLDSSQARTSLPVLFGEIVADEYWESEPRRRQTHVTAARVSADFGSGGNLAAAEMSSRFPEINLYENQLLMLDRAFTSPLHDRGNAHYRYYILDTVEWRGRTAMHLAFVPRRKGEMTFEGEMWLDTMTLALAQVDARLSSSANVNFVRSMQWTQSYVPVTSSDAADDVRWMLDAETMVFDMSITDRTIGAYLRRTTDFEHQTWMAAIPDSIWRSGRDLQFDSLAIHRSDEAWNALRLVDLQPRERNITTMTDSVMGMPQWRAVRGLGYLMGTGYVLAGPLELGAWWSAYTQNPTEGQRFRLDIRTSNAFSTRFMPRVFAAYGTYDQRWKGGFSARHILRKSPRTESYVEVKRDLEQFGMAGLLDQGEVFTSAFRTDTTNLLSEVLRAEASILHEFGPGFTGFVEWRHRQVGSRGNWAFLDPTTAQPIERLITSEATAILRYAKGERFVGGEFDRYSLGTEWPVIEATVTWAMPRVFGSQYNYTRCTLEGDDEIRLGWWGRLEWIAQVGKYFGTAPFPLMEVVPTSGTWLLSPEAFNLLRLFENVTDEWAKATVEWHGEGVAFNHLPLVRRLGWREVVSARGIAGRWDSRHESLLALPEGTTGLNGRYLECGAGFENIFGFLRVEGVWRTDLPLTDPTSWGVRIGFSASI